MHGDDERDSDRCAELVGLSHAAGTHAGRIQGADEGRDLVRRRGAARHARPPSAASHAEIHRRRLALPDVKQKFLDQGAKPRGWTPEQTGQFIRPSRSKWAKVIKSANVTVE